MSLLRSQQLSVISFAEPPYVILIAFSMYTNGEKLFRISKNSNELTCLNGIRFFSMMWVIIGHVFSIFAGIPIVNYIDVIEVIFIEAKNKETFCKVVHCGELKKKLVFAIIP